MGLLLLFFLITLLLRTLILQVLLSSGLRVAPGTGAGDEVRQSCVQELKPVPFAPAEPGAF